MLLKVSVWNSKSFCLFSSFSEDAFFVRSRYIGAVDSEDPFSIVSYWARKACKVFEQMSNELYEEAEGLLYAPAIADWGVSIISFFASQNFKRVILKTTFLKLAGAITQKRISRFGWNLQDFFFMILPSI